MEWAHSGPAVSLPLLAVLFLAVLVAGYTLYGRLIARQYRLDDAAVTPAVALNDGVDFVPTRPFYLLGQHFSAIAAAGPIAGPIIACGLFGWLPSLLWIGLGVVLIGAVHDFSALVASIRHQGRSIAEIAKTTLGPRAWLAMLAFIWIALVYVIVAFADVTATTFVGVTSDIEGETPFNKGGAVSAASALYLLLAIVMGLVQRRLAPPLWLVTLIFVPATLGVVGLGTVLSTWLLLDVRVWAVLIMAYCFVAALLPVWVLVQPRGYLGGFVLYLALAVGVGGIFFGGFDVVRDATTSAPLFGLEKSVFPFLFVTIACGACSGFHGLVCSGTTSKQIEREAHCRPIGYGGMLLEGFVAFIALATIMVVTPEATKGKGPGTIYGDGLARFLTVFTGEGSFRFAATFGAMAFSTFVFDTLDVATRLGRYILQELTGSTSRASAVAGTAATAGVPLVIFLSAGPNSFLTFWALFGTSNQLLAALTLLAVTVWLKRAGRRAWFTFWPMCFVMAITLWSLVGQTVTFLSTLHDAEGVFQFGNLANALVAIALFALAALLVVEAVRAVRKPVPG